MSEAVGALVHSRAHGFVSAQPGMICVLRCLGGTYRIRLTGSPKLGRCSFRWVDDLPPRPSGWPRMSHGTVRAGRLTVVDF